MEFALTDLPSTQSRGIASWDTFRGHLSIEGPRGSGRTTTLSSLAHLALTRGWHVHVIGRADHFAELSTHPGLGTIASPDDPRHIAALLRRITRDAAAPRSASGTAPSRQMILIDDLEETWSALTQLARGSGTEVLVAAMRLPRAAAVSIALTSTRTIPSILTALIGQRLVLAGDTKYDDVARSVPSDLAGLGGPPGRGVWFAPVEPVACQVALIAAGEAHDVGFRAPTGDRPVRIVVIPRDVTTTDLPPIEHAGRTGHTDLIPVGLGGDDARPRSLDVGRGALITGPHGSGRSNVLVAIMRALDPERCLVIARDGPLLDVPARVRITEFSARHLTDTLAALHDAQETGQSRPGPCDAVPWTILLDDAEALLQACPLEQELLTRAHAPGRLIAAATTSAGGGALRGPLAELRTIRTGIVLAPATPGSSDVFGAPLTWLIEPGHCPPGRGVLVHGRDQDLLQVVRMTHPG